MFFDELSNDEWAVLAALVSDEPAVRLNRRGRPRAEPRIVANAVLWILTTGEPWSKLPGRYPSGPTCRRRFEEWQLNGTLLEMVRLLSRTGRTFAYVPQPSAPLAARPPAPVVRKPEVRDESPRGVSWKSPESWRAPGAAGTSTSLENWRAADPIGDITRHLSGAGYAPPVAALRESREPHEPPPRMPLTTPAGWHATHGVTPRPQDTFAYTRGVSSTDATVAIARDAMERIDAAIASANGPVHAAGQVAAQAAAHASQRYPSLQELRESRRALTTSLAPRGTQIDDTRGYAIYVAAESVPNGMYRAWVEIMQDGKRVERSGLVGPRFAQANQAEHYGLEWAHQWIDRQCRTQAAAPLRARSEAGAMSANHHAPAEPEIRAEIADIARPLPPIRHVPEPPPAVNHSGPLHSPLNSYGGPVRRYPVEPASPAAVASADNPNTASERYPSFQELISHAG
ncbi:DUF6566 family protein [Paraburkholderia sp. BCC1886]|uniref:DUF6566 family protein n=1 Tax=Paraburkholderia sp. BCC1886 TaxID=2562670 RepID=UPI001181EAF7|nr:DUF6566 family protein [Paraburkholderia sp. BCC1886]